MFRLFFIIPLMLTSCAGYQLGGSKPSHLAHVRTLHVPLFKNDTLFFRAESHATNSAVDALTRDGTYGIASAETADATLIGCIDSIKYNQVSTSREDSIRPEELSIEIIISWTLLDANDSLRILEKGISEGRSTFFARNNIHIARNNALPDTLRRACESMTTRLADGF